VKRIALSVLVALVLLVPSLAQAVTGAQFAAAGFNAPKDPDVSGVRFAVLYGRNDSNRGADFGFFSFNETGTRSGLGLVWGVSRVRDSSDNAANLALVNFNTGTDKGFNAAFVNVLKNAPKAFSTGFVTVVQGESAVALSGLNMAESAKVQVGFVNVTKKLEGFQLGFVNVAENGFLPVAPFFNFPKR